MARCTNWKQEHRASGSNPWVRRCRTSGGGVIEASIIHWAGDEYRATIQARIRKAEAVAHVYGKTLGAAKAAATRKMQRIERRLFPYVR